MSSLVTEQMGLGIVTELLARGKMVIVRTQADHGIDAIVECVGPERLNGRSFNMQIKSGESYLHERKNDHIVFRFNETHLAYWQTHSLPVIICIVDTEMREAYWELVSTETVKRTGRGFKMLIPVSQTLSTPKSIQYLRSLGNFQRIGGAETCSKIVAEIAEKYVVSERMKSLLYDSYKLFWEKKYEESLKIIEAMDTMFPGVDDLKIQYRLLKFKIGGIEAVESEIFLAVDSESTKVRAATAAILSTKSVRLAIDYLLTKSDGHEIEVLLNQAGLLLKYEKAYEEASRFFRQCLMIRDSAEVRNNLAHSLIGSKQYREALAAFSRAIVLSKGESDYFVFKKSLLLFFLSEFEQAAEGFEHLIARNRNFHSAKLRLAYLHKEFDRNERAIELFLELLGDGIMIDRVNFFLGSLYARIGCNDESLFHFENFYRHWPLNDPGLIAIDIGNLASYTYIADFEKKQVTCDRIPHPQEIQIQLRSTLMEEAITKEFLTSDFDVQSKMDFSLAAGQGDTMILGSPMDDLL